MMVFMLTFIKALGLTVFIECSIAAALRRFAGRLLFPSETPYWRLLAIVALASCLTLPYVWFVFPEIFPGRLAYLISAELFALLVETFWYLLALRQRLRQAFLLSFLANLGSLLFGLFLF